MGASVRPDDLDALIAARRKVVGAPTDDVDALIASRRAAAAPPERPGILSRAGSMISEAALQAVRHPLETAGSILAAPIESAAKIVAPSIEGAERYNHDTQAQARNVARFGGEIHAEGVTGRDRAAAIAQTAVNVAAPGMFRLLSRFAGPTLALAGTGAAANAAYHPEDPAAAALAGGVMSTAVGTGARATVRAVDKVGNLATTARRIQDATPLDESVVRHNKTTEVADRANYGRATSEGEANGGSSPALADALDHPRVKPFADLVRASDKGKGATDAQVATETFKLISRQRRGLLKKMKEGEYDAKADLEAGDLGNAARLLKDATGAASQRPPIMLDIAPETYSVDPQITPGRETLQGHAMEGTAGRARGDQAQVALDASGRVSRVSPGEVQGPAGPAFQLRGQPDKVRPGVEIETPAMRVQVAPAEDVAPVMPSFPTAVSEHARMKGNRAALNEGASATRRLVLGTKVAPEKLDFRGPAAWRERIAELTPEQARYALEGTLGSAQREMVVIPSLPMMAAGTAGGAMFGARGAVAGFLGGVGASAGRTLTQNVRTLNRVSPFIDALDVQMGNPARRPVNPEAALLSAALSQAMANRPSSRR